MGKRVVITGAAGFLGQYMVKEFHAKGGFEIIATDLNGTDLSYVEKLGGKVLQGDLMDENFCKTLIKDAEYVVHSAAIFNLTMPEKEIIYKNSTTTENLCKAASEKGVERFVFISSTDAYGALKIVPAPETHEFKPLNAYAKSKGISEKIAWHYHKNKGLKLSVIRPTAIYGPGSKYIAGVFFFFPLFLKLFGIHRFFGIKGGAKFQLVHAADVAGATAHIIDRPESLGEAYNVAEPEISEAGDFATTLVSSFNFKIEGKIWFPACVISGVGWLMYNFAGPLMWVMQKIFNPRWFKAVEKENLIKNFVPHFEKEFFSYFIGARALDVTKIENTGYKFRFKSFKYALKDVVAWYVENKWVPKV